MVHTVTYARSYFTNTNRKNILKSDEYAIWFLQGWIQEWFDSSDQLFLWTTNREVFMDIVKKTFTF
jgi:hypothetical protein